MREVKEKWGGGRERFCHVGWKLGLLGSGHWVAPLILPPSQQGCAKAQKLNRWHGHTKTTHTFKHRFQNRPALDLQHNPLKRIELLVNPSHHTYLERYAKDEYRMRWRVDGGWMAGGWYSLSFCPLAVVCVCRPVSQGTLGWGGNSCSRQICLHLAWGLTVSDLSFLSILSLAGWIDYSPA